MRANSLAALLCLAAVCTCTGVATDPPGRGGQGLSARDKDAGAAVLVADEEVAPSVPSFRADQAVADRIAPPAMCNLSINEVAAFQSVKSSLWLGGQIVEGGPGLVAGRATLFRVFVSPGPAWPNRLAKARLTLTEPGGSIRVYETEKLMTGPSSDGNGASTFNFAIEGTAITNVTKYHVELDIGEQCRRFEKSRAVPGQGPLPLGAVDMPVLQLVLVPMKYTADGSGRLPDTSQQQLERIKASLLAMLPLRDLQLSVRDVVETNVVLDAQTFPLFLDKVRALRASDNVAMNVHYLGLVAPAPTLADYCQGSCTAGLAFGNMSDDPTLRAGVAVSLPGDEAIRTLIHELGHTLGLRHAPCNTGDALDPLFPHEGGLVGVWGYDERQRKLRDPASVGDFMGYCPDHWISDYSYTRVFDRVRSFAADGRHALTTMPVALHPMTSVWVPLVAPALVGERTGVGAPLPGRSQPATWRPLGGADQALEVQSLPVQDAQGHMWLLPDWVVATRGEVFLPGVTKPLPLPLLRPLSESDMAK